MVERVTCYAPGAHTPVDVDEIADWLAARVDGEVTVADRLLADEPPPGTAEAFADARVRGAHTRETGNTLLGTIRYEERALEEPDRAGGVVYDGHAIQRALDPALDADALGLDHAHVVPLDRVLATWGGDGRWHKRIAVLGQPAVLSVPGLYEAPAKPEAYYEAKGATAMMTGDAPPREVLEAAVDGEFLVEDDPRTTEVLKGYALAAVHYVATGEAFCDEPGCRLSDPHRQPALLEAQLGEPAFCPAHRNRYGPDSGT